MSKKKMSSRKFVIKNSTWSSLNKQTPRTKILHTLRCTLILKDLTLLLLYALYFHSLSVSDKQDLMKSSLVPEKTCQGLRRSLTRAVEHRTPLREVYFSHGFFLTSSASLPSSWDFSILSEPWTIPSQLSILAIPSQLSVHSFCSFLVPSLLAASAQSVCHLNTGYPGGFVFLFCDAPSSEELPEHSSSLTHPLAQLINSEVAERQLRNIFLKWKKRVHKTS